MEDISLLLVCFVCIFIGIHLGINLARIANTKKELSMPSDETGVTKRGIYVEEHQNKLFAYDIKTHQFLCSFTSYKNLHNELMAIDSKSSWVFYEDSRVIIESYMRRHDGANNPV